MKSTEIPEVPDIEDRISEVEGRISDIGFNHDISALESEMGLDDWDLVPLLSRVSDRAALSEREWKGIEAVLRAIIEGRSWKPGHRIPDPAWRKMRRSKLWAYVFHKLIASGSTEQNARSDVAKIAGKSTRSIFDYFAKLKKADPEAWDREERRAKEPSVGPFLSLVREQIEIEAARRAQSHAPQSSIAPRHAIPDAEGGSAEKQGK